MNKQRCACIDTCKCEKSENNKNDKSKVIEDPELEISVEYILDDEEYSKKNTENTIKK